MSNPRSFYSKTMDAATPGGLVGDPISQLNKAYINGAAVVSEVWTVVVPATPDASTAYSITVDGVTVSFTTDATPTQEELSNGLFNSFRTNPEARSLQSIALNGFDLELTSARSEDSHIVSVNDADTTADLSASITTAKSTGDPVGLGVFVARAAGDAVGYAKLPALATDQLIGITTLQQNEEKNAIGDTGVLEYPPESVMDVLERCNSLDGVWMQTPDSDLTIDDPVYVIPGGTNAGWVTKATAGNIDATAVASFQSETRRVNRDNAGTYMVLVRYNKV